MKKLFKVTTYTRYFSRITILFGSIFWFVFALLSGSEEYGGGIKGIVLNSLNALPWLLLFVFVYIAWRWELVGGILVIAMGVFTIFFFDVFKSTVVLFAISIPLIILGILFIINWYINRKSILN